MDPQSFPASEALLAKMAHPRQAALLLHALGEDDRRWLLAQLPEAQRLVLEPLLRELRALGIPADQQLLAQLNPGSEAVLETPSASSSPARDESVVMHASAEHLAPILRGEPPQLIARLLALRSWPWAADLLQLLPDAKARDVKARLRDQGFPSGERTRDVGHNRFDAALLALLRRRLDAAAELHGAAECPPARASKGWRARVPGWWQELGGMRRVSRRGVGANA
jgi:hypothetical protein